MPIIKSAKKRVRVANRAAIRNSKVKRSLKNALKMFSSNAKDETARKAQSEIDKAVKKGVISKNKAARKKSQLASKAKAAGVKTGKAAKKAAPKATPKPTAKKPAAKK